ncbi:MAG: hypothetical protein JWP36_2809 [Paucimonas sp.]|nr:hypothetical protein [Paucimonas sp.]
MPAKLPIPSNTAPKTIRAGHGMAVVTVIRGAEIERRRSQSLVFTGGARATQGKTGTCISPVASSSPNMMFMH